MDILNTRRAAVTRAAQALLLLTLPFIVGVLVLIPDQPSRLLGAELLLTACVFGMMLRQLDKRAQAQQLSQTDRLARTLKLVSPSVTTMVGLILTSASLIAQWGGGLYWMVPTVLVAVVGGVLSAWLFLVESTGADR